MGGGGSGKIMFSRSIRTENNNLQAFLCSLNNSSYFLYKMIKDKIQEGKGTTNPIFCRDSGLVIKDSAVGNSCGVSPAQSLRQSYHPDVH